MELEEIAETIGMNLSTVKSHLYRALAILRERMGGKK
jgi:RNA polymerase sigma-70 factor (ECF subfamily)